MDKRNSLSEQKDKQNNAYGRGRTLEPTTGSTKPVLATGQSSTSNRRDRSTIFAGDFRRRKLFRRELSPQGVSVQPNGLATLEQYNRLIHLSLLPHLQLTRRHIVRTTGRHRSYPRVLRRTTTKRSSK